MLRFLRRHQKQLYILVIISLFGLGVSGLMIDALLSIEMPWNRDPYRGVAGTLFGEKVPGTEVDATWGRLQRYRAMRYQSRGATAGEAWHHVLMTRVAREMGIRVGDGELREALKAFYLDTEASRLALEDVQKMREVLEGRDLTYYYFQRQGERRKQVQWDPAAYRRLFEAHNERMRGRKLMALAVRIPEFEETFREELAIEKAQEVVRQGAALRPEEVWEEYQRDKHRRRLDLVAVAAADHAQGPAQVFRADPARFYDEHRARYQRERTVDVEWVFLPWEASGVTELPAFSDDEARAWLAMPDHTAIFKDLPPPDEVPGESDGEETERRFQQVRAQVLDLMRQERLQVRYEQDGQQFRRRVPATKDGASSAPERPYTWERIPFEQARLAITARLLAEYQRTALLGRLDPVRLAAAQAASQGRDATLAEAVRATLAGLEVQRTGPLGREALREAPLAGGGGGLLQDRFDELAAGALSEVGYGPTGLHLYRVAAVEMDAAARYAELPEDARRRVEEDVEEAYLADLALWWAGSRGRHDGVTVAVLDADPEGLRAGMGASTTEAQAWEEARARVRRAREALLEAVGTGVEPDLEALAGAAGVDLARYGPEPVQSLAARMGLGGAGREAEVEALAVQRARAVVETRDGARGPYLAWVLERAAGPDYRSLVDALLADMAKGGKEARRSRAAEHLGANPGRFDTVELEVYHARVEPASEGGPDEAARRAAAEERLATALRLADEGRPAAEAAREAGVEVEPVGPRVVAGLAGGLPVGDASLASLDGQVLGLGMGGSTAPLALGAGSRARVRLARRTPAFDLAAFQQTLLRDAQAVGVRATRARYDEDPDRYREPDRLALTAVVGRRASFEAGLVAPSEDEVEARYRRVRDQEFAAAAPADAPAEGTRPLEEVRADVERLLSLGARSEEARRRTEALRERLAREGVATAEAFEAAVREAGHSHLTVAGSLDDLGRHPQVGHGFAYLGRVAPEGELSEVLTQYRRARFFYRRRSSVPATERQVGLEYLWAPEGAFRARVSSYTSREDWKAQAEDLARAALDGLREEALARGGFSALRLPEGVERRSTDPVRVEDLATHLELGGAALRSELALLGSGGLTRVHRVPGNGAVLARVSGVAPGTPERYTVDVALRLYEDEPAGTPREEAVREFYERNREDLYRLSGPRWEPLDLVVDRVLVGLREERVEQALEAALAGARRRALEGAGGAEPPRDTPVSPVDLKAVAAEGGLVCLSLGPSTADELARGGELESDALPLALSLTEEGRLSEVLAGGAGGSRFFFRVDRRERGELPSYPEVEGRVRADLAEALRKDRQDYFEANRERYGRFGTDKEYVLEYLFAPYEELGGGEGVTEPTEAEVQAAWEKHKDTAKLLGPDGVRPSGPEAVRERLVRLARGEAAARRLMGRAEDLVRTDEDAARRPSLAAVAAQVEGLRWRLSEPMARGDSLWAPEVRSFYHVDPVLDRYAVGEISPTLENDHRTGLFLFRVKSADPPEPPSYASVADRVAADLYAERSMQAAWDAARGLLDAAREGGVRGLEAAAARSGLPVGRTGLFARTGVEPIEGFADAGVARVRGFDIQDVGQLAEEVARDDVARVCYVLRLAEREPASAEAFPAEVPSIKKALAASRDWKRQREWEASLKLEALGLSEETVAEAYRRDMDDIELEARHVLIKLDEAEARIAAWPDERAREVSGRALDRVRGGEDFAAVARELSEDPRTRSRGGTLGTVREGEEQEYGPIFRDAALALAEGATSGLVKTPAGYHVIRCDRRVDRGAELSHILVHLYDKVPTRAQREGIYREYEDRARDVARRARAGEDFAELARAHSQDEANREKGGDLGRFGKGTMVEPFWRAALELDPGQVSDPVRTRFGFHVIRLEARRHRTELADRRASLVLGDPRDEDSGIFQRARFNREKGAWEVSWPSEPGGG
ncbi:MAG: peptidylprolyl isomerase [Planctomycetes bacterium]|nr:peptidylprolyl isomerase [Planctomycetota bacterium]